MFRWNFVGQGLTDDNQSVLGCRPTIYRKLKLYSPCLDICCLSVVDVSALKTPEFVYLISEYAGEVVNIIIDVELMQTR
jgi:hypothetical protein